MAAAIATDLPGAQQRTFLTVVLTISLATLIAGGFFFVLGSLELGNLIRFIPYPVIGGFLAGTGWLLAKGAMEVLSGMRLSVSDISALARSEVAAKWISGVAFGVLLYVAVRRYRHYLTLPGTLLGGLISFYLCVLVTGHTVADAESAGWLIGPFPSQGGWEPWAARALGSADWGAVLGQALGAATLLAVAVLGLLLNVSGIELSTNRDADLNRELRSAGIANVAAGAAGGMPGFHGVILTVLAHRTGVSSRWVGVVGGVVSWAALLSGASVVGMLTRPLLGGLLLFLGLAFLVEWAYDSRRRLSRAEYAIVWVILLVIAGPGGFRRRLTHRRCALCRRLQPHGRCQARPVRSLLPEPCRAGARGADAAAPPGRAAPDPKTPRLHLLRDRKRPFQAGPRPNRRHHPSADGGPHPGLSRRDGAGFVRGHWASLGSTVLLRRAASRWCHGATRSGPPRLGACGLIGKEGNLQDFADLDRGVQWCEDQWLESNWGRTRQEQPPAADLAQVLGDRLDVPLLMPYLERQELPARACVVRQGEAPADVFFIESGRLTATLALDGSDPVQLRVMGPGTVVGEVSLYSGNTWTASVVTDTPCIVYRLSRRALADMEGRQPHLAAGLHALFAHRLAERLADVTETVKVLRD